MSKEILGGDVPGLIICGDCKQVLEEFPPDYVDMVLTSPPY